MVAPSSLPTMTSSRGSHSFQELTGAAVVSRPANTWAKSLIARRRSHDRCNKSGIAAEGQESSDCGRPRALVGAARHHAHRSPRSAGARCRCRPAGSIQPAPAHGGRSWARGRRSLGLMAERPQEVAAGGGGEITPERANRGAPVPAVRVDFSAEDRRWIAEQIEEALASGQLTLGRYGAQFEQEFSRYCGLEHGVAVGSGTAALEIILRSLAVADRDVLVPANTFFATAAAVIHAGGRPVLMDTDPEPFGTAPAELQRRLTPATTGAIVVHIGGPAPPRRPA